jgi:muramoyltetrapeptide carboxypeptidase
LTRKPAPLRPGAVIGIVSPSSPITPEIVAPGVKALEERGYNVVFAPNAWDGDGHRAGTPRGRAEDFARFYADPAIDLIWCAKGGSSACLLREHLDWDALAELPPKIVIGFSDVSSLHVPLNQRLNVPSIHGPLLFHVGRVIGEAELAWMMRLVEQAEAPLAVPGAAAETLLGGKARGKLAGGCLSLIRNTLGTPYQIDATGSLFLIEDIDEKPWSIERDLWQLRECGVLQKAAGIIVGEASNADDARTVPMARIWRELLEPLGKPCVTGFPFGHVSPNWALPLGCEAELDADTGTLTLLEMPVE